MLRFAIAAAVIGGATLAQAATIASFNFNSTSNDATTSTGSATASTGSGTAATVGGATLAYNAGSNDDANTTDNSALAFSGMPAQGAANKTAGVAFTGTSTSGYTNISVSFSLRASGTASRYYQLQFSTDGGANYNDVSGGTAGQPTFAGTAAITSSVPTGSIDTTGLVDLHENSGSQVFIYPYTYTFAAGSAVENTSQFAFRLVSTFAPSTTNYAPSSDASTYGTAGNTRIDSVVISGTATTSTPEPASLALLGLGGLAVLRRRRA